MSNKKRVKKLEGQTSIGQELIDEIQVEIINSDGSPGGTLVSKQVNGVWSNYEKQD